MRRAGHHSATLDGTREIEPRIVLDTMRVPPRRCTSFADTMPHIKPRRLLERPRARLVEEAPAEGRPRTLRLRVDGMVCDV
jgi:hypothetical protein